MIMITITIQVEHTKLVKKVRARSSDYFARQQQQQQETRRKNTKPYSHDIQNNVFFIKISLVWLKVFPN